MSAKSMRQQFADTILEVGQMDENLMVLVGDISHFILQPFAKACPDRYYNVGICEPTIVSMAAGLAKVGFFPVVHTIAPFIIERAFEQIKLDFSYHRLGGNLVTVGSAFDYANLGCTHHCYGDFALIKTLPNTQIFYPSTPVEFDALFKQNYKNGRVNLFRIPQEQHSISFDEKEIITGRGIKVAEGTDATVIVTGPQLNKAIQARNELLKEGIELEILYMHTIIPLDTELVKDSSAKTRRVLVIEEHMERGGLGDEVLRTIRCLKNVNFSSLSIPNQFVTEYGGYDILCESVGFTVDNIRERVRSLISNKSRKECKWVK